MMMQNHLLAGYLIARVIPDPLIGLPLAFASHYLLDLVTYPSKEMEIRLQDEWKTERDKVTYGFTISNLILISLIVILTIIIKQQMNPYMIAALILANLPDFWGQFWPLLKRKRKTAVYAHEKVLTRNPYSQIIIHQTFTFLGFLFLLSF